MRLFTYILSLFLAFASQPVPIPSHPEGYKLGAVNATFIMEVYYDHLCSASSGSYPSLIQFWKKSSSWLQLNIHIFPLPYHHLAFEVSALGKYIQLNYPDSFLNYLEYIFKTMDTYLVFCKSQEYSHCLDLLASEGSKATGISSGELRNSLKDEKIIQSAVASWKFGAGRGISGTPHYVINGVLAPEASENGSLEEWMSFYNKLKTIK
jgi:hypothetical protein